MNSDIIMNLQKWAQQPTSDSGYKQPFQFGFQVLTTLYPDVVFGQEGMWQVFETNKPVVAFPWAKRNNSSVIKRNVKLGSPLEFDYTSGDFINIKLERTIALAQVFQDMELIATEADFLGFRIQEAIKQVQREYENIAVEDLCKQGIDGVAAGLQVLDSDTKTVDIYQTLLNLQVKMLETGNNLADCAIFVSPAVMAKIMTNKWYVANGIGQIPAEEVRYGFRGTIIGFNIYVMPRLPEINKSLDSSIQCNMIAVDNSQVMFFRNMVEPVVMKPAPTNYPGKCSFLTCWEYVRHFLVNKEGLYFFNLTLTAE